MDPEISDMSPMVLVPVCVLTTLVCVKVKNCVYSVFRADVDNAVEVLEPLRFDNKSIQVI